MRVLYVATDLRDADILRQEVRRVEPSLTLDICAGLSELRARPDQPSAYDILLMDCGLAEPEQLQLIHYVRVRQLNMPVVAVSPQNAPVPTAALSAGVDDYLVRGPKFSERLGPMLRLSTDRYRTVSTTLREFEKVKKSEARLRLIIEALPTGVVLLDQAGKVLAMNMAGVQQFGITSPQDIVGRSFTTLMPMEDHPAMQDFLAKAIGGEEASVQFSSTRDEEDGRAYNLRGLCIQKDAQAGQSSVLGVLERVSANASLQPAWSPDFDLDVATLTSSSALPPAPLDDHLIEELQAKVKELETRGQAADSRIGEMEGELLRVRGALEQAQARESAAAEQLKRAHEEASQLVVESGSLRQALYNEQEQRTTAEEHARKAEAQARAIEEQVRQTDERVREQEANARGADERAKAAEERVGQAEEHIRRAEEQIRQAGEQLRGAEERLHAAEAQAREIDQLRRSIEDERRAFEEQRRILDEQRLSTEAHVRSMEEQRHAAEEGKRIVDEQRRAAEDQVRELEERRRQAEEQSQAAHERARQAEEALHGLQDQARHTEEQARIAQEELRRAQEQLHGAEEHARNVQEQLHGAEEQARSAHEQLHVVQDQLQHAHEQLRGAEDHARTMQEQLQHAHEQVRGAEDHARGVQEQLRASDEHARQMEARAQSAEEQARHAAEAQHGEALAAVVTELQQARAELAALTESLQQQRAANESLQQELGRRDAHVAELEVRAQTRIADIEQEHRLAVERLQELLEQAMKESPTQGAAPASGGPLMRTGAAGGASQVDATKRGFERVGRLATAMSDDLIAAIHTAKETAHAVLDVLPPGSHGHEQAKRSLEAVQRCEELARHLFRLSSRHTGQNTRVDLAQLVRHQEQLLHHLAGPDIELQFDLAVGLCSTELDAQDVSQVLTSLIVAARDALPLGGVIRVGTAFQHRAQDSNPDAARGAERPRPLMLGVTAKGYGIRPVSSATCEEVTSRAGGTLTTVIEPNVSWTLIAMLPGGVADAIGSADDNDLTLTA